MGFKAFLIALTINVLAFSAKKIMILDWVCSTILDSKHIKSMLSMYASAILVGQFPSY
jgi:hypothetical protein